MDQEQLVDITGIDRTELLKELWLNSKDARFYTLNNIDSPYGKQFKYPTDDEVKSFKRCGDVDYYKGRMIKCDVYGESNKLDPWLYIKRIKKIYGYHH